MLEYMFEIVIDQHKFDAYTSNQYQTWKKPQEFVPKLPKRSLSRSDVSTPNLSVKGDLPLSLTPYASSKELNNPSTLDLNNLNHFEIQRDLENPNFISSCQGSKKRSSSACKSRKQQLISDYKKMNAHSNLKHK
jgi:hypothetical protein